MKTQKNTKKERLYSRITKQGNALIQFFNLPQDTEPVKLCKSLLRLENKYSFYSTRYCNGEIEWEEFEMATAPIIKKVCKILNSTENVLHFNNDPRGYALKIEDKLRTSFPVGLHTDMGGYGIIAPDFREFNYL